MLVENARAVEFVKASSSGRTGPLIFRCETQFDGTVELFCKFSAGCDEGPINLAREIIGVCLAADLGLPVPKPYLVEVPELLSKNLNPEVEKLVSNSVKKAFGSMRANQFSLWVAGSIVSSSMLSTVAATFVFDAICQNVDRRTQNPNCLVRGDEIRLIDHELAFTHELLLGWQPPWEIGSLQALAHAGGRHIFFDGLRNKEIDWAPIKSAWSSLTDARLQEYLGSLPPEWSIAQDKTEAAISLIADARDRIDQCLTEVQRVLKC